jgi:hypothetical protein
VRTRRCVPLLFRELGPTTNTLTTDRHIVSGREEEAALPPGHAQLRGTRCSLGSRRTRYDCATIPYPTDAVPGTPEPLGPNPPEPLGRCVQVPKL